MSTPILATKLYIPRPQPNAIDRARLLERLHEGLHCKLTLLSAPAGFGKTTLVTAWLATPTSNPPRPIAWLSLGEEDNDLTRFLAYLVAAVQTVAPEVGGGVMRALHAAQPPATEAVLSMLLNELAALTHPFVLVLDDYHVIDTPAIDHALTFLLEHLPRTMHIVITTREDPPLPLARYRVRGQLVELRATDLRFTTSEAADFLNQVMGLELAAPEIAVLESRTEGWIAGLQLAALSMQGHDDIPGFIRSFAGDHRYIVDYLVEEVVAQQPAHVQNFLLHTSILDRLCGPLCEAVTGQAHGRAQLEMLERGNFFVVPLDDKRHWYRYHHLFADLLRARLMAEQPAQVAVLHQRASVWFEAQDAMPDAIRHALAAGDFIRVADLLEAAIPAMGRERAGPTFLGWIKALPRAIIEVRPVLCVGYAWASMSAGEFDAVEPWLMRAESWLERCAELGARPVEMVVANEAEFRHLAGRIAIYRAGVAHILGRVADTEKYARQVLELVPEEDVLGRGAGTALLGLALWAGGELALAHQTYADGMARVQRVGNISDVINSANFLAGIRLAQGRLADVMSTYAESLRFAAQQGGAHLPATADHYVGMSEVHYAQNDLAAATQCLVRSKELSEHSPLPHNRARWYVAMARIRQAQGDVEGARDLLEEAARVDVPGFHLNVQPVAAWQARLWVSQGRLDQAQGWAHAHALSVFDELSYLREFEHITLARVLLARYQHDRGQREGSEAPWHEVMELLKRLLAAAQAGGRLGSAVEILVLQARTHQAQGDIPAALVLLQQALTLAEPEGYLRLFMDEGPPMTQLLHEAEARGLRTPYAGVVLAAMRGVSPNAASQTPRAHPPVVHPLIEPLSERELEVLRLFQTELSGPEIADRLVIALSTVRTHTKGIYSKLHVNSRRAAVLRAAELNLL